MIETMDLKNFDVQAVVDFHNAITTEFICGVSRNKYSFSKGISLYRKFLFVFNNRKYIIEDDLIFESDNKGELILFDKCVVKECCCNQDFSTGEIYYSVQRYGGREDWEYLVKLIPSVRDEVVIKEDKFERNLDF